MKRRSLTWVLSAAVAGGLGFALRASAQPAAGVPRIGVLRWGAAGDDAQLDLRAALAALGYREGETLLVEWRFARTGDQARRHAAELAQARGFAISNCDVTLICERPKVGPHAGAMQAALAAIMGIAVDRVSVKATTSERLGFTGREEGIASIATATLVKL